MAPNGTTNGASGFQTPQWTPDDTIPLFLNGKQITTSTTFDVTSPVTHKVIYKCASASPDDALAAIESAQAAFPAWAKLKPAARRDIFLRAAEGFEARTEECWQYIRQETGAERSWFDSIYRNTIEACKDGAGSISSLQGATPVLAEEGSSAIIRKEPFGVILGIAPWNAPYILGLRACLQPLLCGNTVVLKGPELSPATFWAISSVLHNAGLPPGVLNTIYHRPGPDAAAVTEALISSPLVKKVNFTGSTAVGSIIASLSGKHLKPVLMELGGKASAIVCEDADMETAAMGCALGAFLHSGQVCMSTERILVNKKVVEPFRDALRSAMDVVFGGPDALILINAPPVSKNHKLLSDAVSKGAKISYGDLDAKQESQTRMRPIIVENVQQGMDIYHTESFGPTVSLYVVDSDEEAIKVANDTEYGLSSAVFTEDLRRGLRIAAQIESGAVHINSMTIHDESVLPHGGTKKSGWGRFNGQEGLQEWVRTKTITWKD